MTGQSMDVVEMDAASNNSVDDIRELRENVALAPMGGGSRVYILDEAHMLTPAAWNAFLKTLEEPPAHVVFVLATTEAHKVPDTIVDRCHRFDFQRPTLQQIAGVLDRVAAEEDIEVPDAAIGMLARAATGSFRDALGTLEQLVTYGGNEIKLDDVLEILGVADAELVLQASDALVAHDPKAALLAVERLADSGRDINQFMRDLAAHLRHLYVVQTLGEVPDSFSVTAEHTDRLAAQAEALAQGEVLRAIELLAAVARRGQGRVRPAHPARAGAAEGGPAAGRPVHAGAALPDRAARGARARRARGRPGAADRRARPRGRRRRRERPCRRPPSRRGGSGGGTGRPDRRRRGGLAGARAAPEVGRAEPAAPAPAPAAAPPAARAPRARVRAPVADRPAAPPARGPAPDLARVDELWPAAVDAVAAENGMVGAFLAPRGPSSSRARSSRSPSRPTPPSARRSARTTARCSRPPCARSPATPSRSTASAARSDATEASAVTLSHDELVDRLKEQFGAKEVFDDGEQT